MMNVFTYILALFVAFVAGCSKKQDSASPAAVEATPSEMKDTIFQERIKQKKNSVDSTVEGLPLLASPGYFVAEWPVIVSLGQKIFGATITLTDTEKARLGGMFLSGNTFRLKDVPQTYIQVIRQKFYQPCRTLVTAELAQVKPENKFIRNPVPTKEDLNHFMQLVFRSKPVAGGIHIGAEAYALEIARILQESPTQNKTDLFATTCLAIVSDLRTLVR